MSEETVRAEGRALTREETTRDPRREMTQDETTVDADPNMPIAPPAFRAAGREMTQDELQALPVSVDIVTAGRAWGLGRTKAYELARTGEFPCRVLKIGPAYRVTRADLFRSLGLTPDATPVSA
jgi:hypothetical protein